jgi:hypothetical protein
VAVLARFIDISRKQGVGAWGLDRPWAMRSQHRRRFRAEWNLVFWKSELNHLAASAREPWSKNSLCNR